MRLVQKSKEQTGVLIIKYKNVVRFIPLFSKDVLAEIKDEIDIENPEVSVLGVYTTLSSKQVKEYLEEIKKFKEEHGSFPRMYLDQLRSGFATGKGLNQCSDLCLYK